MNRIIIAATCVTCLIAMGCSSQHAVQSSSPARCNVENTAWAIGQVGNEANGRKLFQQSGAGLWRIITPDSTKLADYRDDRLNVHVDRANVITSVDCG